MNETPDFFRTFTDDLQPFERALEWLLGQRLSPGDEIYQADITNALGMVNPDLFGTRRLIKQWEMARLSQVEMLLCLFEERSGLIVMPTYKGSYEVLEPDEVAEVVLDVTLRRVRKALSLCNAKISRAAKDTASPAELQRRSQASQYVNNVRHFMDREGRKSLDDEAA